MSCSYENEKLVPCPSLGKSIAFVNVDPSKISTGRLMVHQYCDTNMVPIKDVVFILSSQGDDEPLVLKYCPFCGVSIHE